MKSYFNDGLEQYEQCDPRYLHAISAFLYEYEEYDGIARWGDTMIAIEPMLQRYRFGSVALDFAEALEIEAEPYLED